MNRAEMIVTFDDTGWRHVVIRSIGDSDADALLSVVELFSRLTAVCDETVVRVAPSAEKFADFTTETVEHRGYARFSYR